jgi:hypothetical protein
VPDRRCQTGRRYALVLVVGLDFHLSIGEKGKHKGLVDVAHSIQQRRQVSDLCCVCTDLLIGDRTCCFLVVVEEIHRVKKNGTVPPFCGASSRREVPYGSLEPAIAVDSMESIER